MNVRNLMSSPAVTVRLDESVEAAQRRMRAHRINYLIAVDADGNAVGVVDKESIQAQQGPITALVAPLAASLREDDSADRAKRLVADQAIPCVPVLAGMRPVGMVCAADLRRAAFMDWKSIPAIRAA